MRHEFTMSERAALEVFQKIAADMGWGSIPDSIQMSDRYSDPERLASAVMRDVSLETWDSCQIPMCYRVNLTVGKPLNRNGKEGYGLWQVIGVVEVYEENSLLYRRYQFRPDGILVCLGHLDNFHESESVVCSGNAFSEDEAEAQAKDHTVSRSILSKILGIRFQRKIR